MESITLVNVNFPFSFDGKEYHVKKANLEQVILFQRKSAEIAGDASVDLMMAAYAIYLILYAVDKNVTEEFVKENCPGDIDVVAILSQLGFMNQQKVEAMQKLRNALGN